MAYGDYRRGERARPRRPPRHKGDSHLSVPQWEKRFCTDACIPWGKLCETKGVLSLYKGIVEWDDSAGFESFRNAKARFFAQYHGQTCDIPLPDPDLYIQEVNFDEIIEPELVADIEKARIFVPAKDIPKNDEAPAPSGWGDEAVDSRPVEDFATNWDIYVDSIIEDTGSEQMVPPSTSQWDASKNSLIAWNQSVYCNTGALQHGNWRKWNNGNGTSLCAQRRSSGNSKWQAYDPNAGSRWRISRGGRFGSEATKGASSAKRLLPGAW